jgi:diguanylate cyclase
LDLDKFKVINDNFGHHTGDRALRQLAGILRSVLRPVDICVRYAGDEFVVFLPDCGTVETSQARADIQAAVAQSPFEASPGQPLRLSVSIGAAVHPDDGATVSALFGVADRRMYEAKADAARRAGLVDDVPTAPQPVRAPETAAATEDLPADRRRVPERRTLMPSAVTP